jgi:hypothetical protein
VAGCLAAGSFFSAWPAFLTAQETPFSPSNPVTVNSASDAPLRWKAKPIHRPQHSAGVSAIGAAAAHGGVMQASHTNAAPAEDTAPGGWNKMRIDTYVRPVQATSPADPFADPFGDRHATRKASALQLQGAEQAAHQQPGGFFQPPGTGGLGGTGNPNAPGANVNPGTENPAGPTPGFQQPGAGPFAPPANSGMRQIPLPGNVAPPQNDLDNPPAPAEAFDPNQLTPAPGNEPSAPLDRAIPYGEKQQMVEGLPCEKRTYDELNCCDSDANCRAFIQGLLRDRLSNISLDITPRFMPDKDLQEDQTQREARMKLSGVREWHDRRVRFEDRANYEPLATGQLLNLVNGKAVIGNEAGQVVANIPLNDLSEDDLCFVSGWWKLPAECAIASNQQIDNYSRGWMPSTLNWHASALCHKPLYFEQVQLERYGHTAGPFKQPFVSGAHFFGSVVMLPYKMALDAPWECEYALGYYRPGSCAPWHIPPFPFSPRAAMAQAGFVVGGIYIIP